MEMVLGMAFLALSNVDFQFDIEKLTWRFYTTAKAIPTTSWVKLIDKREFVKKALHENSEIFLMHVSALDVTESLIDSSQVAQIATL